MSKTALNALKTRYKASLNNEYRDQTERISQISKMTAIEIINALLEEE